VSHESGLTKKQDIDRYYILGTEKEKGIIREDDDREKECCTILVG
jgi:hypothetical protein